MKVTPLALPGALLIEPEVFRDARGAFFESWNARAYAALDIPAVFKQENVSISQRFVLRGLHYQLPRPQGKLIRVLSGEIFDVVVDLRRSSAAFGTSVSLRLRASCHSSLWVPPGFAHGLLALADDTCVQYKVTDFWQPDCERTLAWNDPELAISWPLPVGTEPVLSEKDRLGRPLGDAETFA